MKKELNGKSRRKFVVGGAMVFGSIALLSTGFATWVIGASNNTDQEGITVEVDTVENKSVTLEATVATGDKILFCDPSTADGSTQLVKVKDSTQDLNVSVSLKAYCSSGWLGSQANPGAVNVGFVGTTNLISADTLATAHADAELKDAWNGRTPDAKIGESTSNNAFKVFTSVEISDKGQWTKVDAESSETLNVFTKTVVLTFGYGSNALFGGETTFAEFVSKMYGGHEDEFANDAKMYDEIENEMTNEITAIETAMAGLTVEVGVAQNNPTAETYAS